MRFGFVLDDGGRMRFALLAALATSAVAMTSTMAVAEAVQRGDRPVLEVAQRLKPGQYVWSPDLSGDGSALVIVNLKTQRLILFRNGVPIAASTVSSGKTGNETPTGVFSILQKNEKHFSKTYNNAAMPNMQRLTWRGIALHAGNLPGYPASHGCIRLPLEFSKLLFGSTSLGMTVVITTIPAVPATSGSRRFDLGCHQRGRPAGHRFPGRQANRLVAGSRQWRAQRGGGIRAQILGFDRKALDQAAIFGRGRIDGSRGR